MDKKEVNLLFKQLRDVTRRTGVVHEQQLINLKTWAAVPGVFELKVDGSEQKVVLNYPKMTKKHQGHFPSVFSKSVKWLLGPTWKVDIYLNGKPIFVGRRSEPLKINQETPQETPWRDRLNQSQQSNQS